MRKKKLEKCDGMIDRNRIKWNRKGSEIWTKPDNRNFYGPISWSDGALCRTIALYWDETENAYLDPTAGKYFTKAELEAQNG